MCFLFGVAWAPLKIFKQNLYLYAISGPHLLKARPVPQEEAGDRPTTGPRFNPQPPLRVGAEPGPRGRPTDPIPGRPRFIAESEPGTTSTFQGSHTPRSTSMTSVRTSGSRDKALALKDARTLCNLASGHVSSKCSLVGSVIISWGAGQGSAPQVQTFWASRV